MPHAAGRSLALSIGSVLALGVATLSRAAAQTPVVDSEVKLSQTAGGFSGKLDNEDRFGGAVASLGDLDGDGIADVAVTAIKDDDGQPQAGAVWILFLDAGGSVKSTRKISATQGGFGGSLSSNDDFGTAVAGLGDLNGDGHPDLAVGADGNGDGNDLDDEQQGPGAVWILDLQADGSVSGWSRIGDGAGGFSGDLDHGDEFGGALALLGDLDGDGRLELAAGAPGDDEVGASAGAIWILHLQADGNTAGQTLLSASSGGLVLPLHKGDQLGRALASPGDLDGDAIPALLAGTPGADDGDGADDNGEDRGALRAMQLHADGTVADETLISGLQGGFGGKLDKGDEFGIAVAAAPDDGSLGHLRAFAGAWRDDDGGSNRGALWVLDFAGSSGSAPYEPFLETVAGQSGQPTVLLPGPPPTGDDFIGEPVVVVPAGDKVFGEQLQAAGSGALGFATEATTVTGKEPVGSQSQDFSGDGQPDIVTANRGGDSLSLLKQVSAATDGGDSFAPKVDFTLPFDDAPVALRAADMNGDGDFDVVVAGDGGVTTFLGDGAGTLVAAEFAPVGLLADLGVADLDADGVLDVVTASGAPAAGPGAETGFATALLGDGTGALSSTGTFATGHAVATVLLADFDGDGPPDALLAIHDLDSGPGGVPQGRIELYVGNGTGLFQASPVFGGYASPNVDGVHPRWGATADVDDDGRPDALYTSNDSLALPEGSLGSEQPPVALTLLRADAAGGFGVSTIATAYVGKGVAPVLFDIAPQPGDGHVDCVLVWSQDTLAGVGDGTQGDAATLTFLAALVGDGTGSFTDATPNQFLAADEPGDPSVDEVGSPAADGAGGPDILLPDMADGSLVVLLGDGLGGIADKIVVPDVDPTDVDALPAGGVWQGGPRTALGLDLDAGARDVAIWSQWDDVAGLFASRAALATLVGDGTGHFAPKQAFVLPHPGDLAVGDVSGDGLTDVAYTQRTGGAQDSVVLLRSLGDGTLAAPLSATAPAGLALSGGFAASNVDGVAGAELVTTASDGSNGVLIAYKPVGAALLPRLSTLGVAWDEVRSLDLGDLDGDGLQDAAIGVADGRLVLARGLPGGFFELLPTSPAAAAAGGDAIRLGQIDGDGQLDLVSSNAADSGTLDQAFVRELFGTGNGAFVLSTLPGVSSVGAIGALRPAIADLNGDGAADLVLAHGGSGNVSLLLNALSTFEAFGTGKPGTGGIVPALAGQGFTTLGGSITVKLDGGLGGAPGLLLIGSGKIESSWVVIGSIAASVPIFLSGTPGVPGAGSWSVAAHLPNLDRFAGIEIVLQILVADPGAVGLGLPGLSLSNGLSFTILP